MEWTHEPADPLSWIPLAVTGNAPLYPAVAHHAGIEDTTLGASARLYRPAVSEP